MLVKDYLSYYHLLHAFPVYKDFEKKISWQEFMEDNPEYDLNDRELQQLETNELFSLQNFLEKLRDERELIALLRNMFDEYRSDGGNPFHWLTLTFNSVSGNPQNFPPHHLGVIEKNLILWIDNFTKQPYDVLWENSDRNAESIDNLTLKNILVDETDLQLIMTILASQDIVDQETGHWIDEKKGSYGYLVKILKILGRKQYYKLRATNKMYVEIAKNTFNIEMSLETAKKNTPGPKEDFNFLPYKT